MTIVEREVVEAPAVVPVTTRDVLHRAADLLEEFGWCQGLNATDASGCATNFSDGGAVSFCLVGATQRAAADFGLIPRVFSWPEVEPANVLLEDALGKDDGELVRWNNAPSRTKAEVVARLREAAEAAT